MESTNPFSFRKTIIFAAMDQQLRCRPFVHEIGRTHSYASYLIALIHLVYINVPLSKFLAFGFPRSATPFVVELFQFKKRKQVT